jgi:SPP1 family predicted phage head-tail adaptor
MADYYFLGSRLNQRALFRKPVSERQSNGSMKTTWRDHKTLFAEIITIGGEEGREALAQSSEVRYRLIVRYRKDIDESMKIIAPDGRELAVRSIRDPDGRRVMLEINAIYKQGGV